MLLIHYLNQKDFISLYFLHYVFNFIEFDSGKYFFSVVKFHQCWISRKYSVRYLYLHFILLIAFISLLWHNRLFSWNFSLQLLYVLNSNRNMCYILFNVCNFIHHYILYDIYLFIYSISSLHFSFLKQIFLWHYCRLIRFM